MPKICRVSTYIYEKMCETPSDIHEHLPTLMNLAMECDTIVEMGGSCGGFHVGVH